MKYLLIAVISYLIGNISGSFIIGNLFLNKDIRKFGSGNAGTTNAFRVLGQKAGLVTFVIDFFKGIILVLIIRKFFGYEYVPFGILFGVLGHDYPFYMSFKGGKGMAMTLGSLAIFSFKFTIIPYIIWLIIALTFRYISLASIMFFISSIISYGAFGDFSLENKILIAIVCLLGIIRHKSNIKRLLNGNENRIGGKKWKLQ